MFSVRAVNDRLSGMDSNQVSNQEAANRAQIENTRLSRQMLKIMWATLAFGAVSAACAIVAVWPSSEAGGGSMRNWIWIPAIILGLGSLSTATALVIVAFKRWRYKKLATLADQLQSDLTQAKTDLADEQSKPKPTLEDTEQIENLKAQLETDKKGLQNLVRVCAVYYIPQFDINDRLQTFIDFTFYVFNNSLHDIVISEKLPGHIEFGSVGDAFSRSCEIENKKPIPCHARSDCRVRVRQFVDNHEIGQIKAADNMYFWFEHLGITFTLAKEPQAEPITLRTNQTVQTKAGRWHSYDIPEYVFALNAEQWAEVIKDKSVKMVKEETELRATITALSSQNDSLKNDIAYEKQSAGKQMDTYKANLAEFDRIFNLWGPIMGRAQEQARAINNWVVMKEAKLESLQLVRTPRMVAIAIRLLNESVYKITINLKDIKGRLHFMARPLGGDSVGENVTVPTNAEPIEDLEPRRPALLILEQPVTETQAETILAAQKSSDPNGLFSLADLQIPISVKSSPEEVDVRSLRVSSEYEHLYINDFGKTTIASTLDRAVQAIVEADRANVSKSVFVAVRGINFDLLMLEKRLDFMFEVFNGSVFPVSISARSNGFIQHDGKYLSQYTVFDAAQSDDLQRGQRTVVTLRHERIEPEKCQALQADFDAEKPITFDFGGLTLWVRITDPNETGKLSNLELPDGIIWRKGSIFGRIVHLSTSVTSTSDTSLETN
jgi:hypothetical protein